MSIANTRTALAMFLRGQAEWRRRIREEYPDDDRNTRWAENLDLLADRVVSLPDNDERLIQIHEVFAKWGLDVFCLPGDEHSDTHRLTSRPELNPRTSDDLEEAMHLWLDQFATTYVVEAAEEAGDEEAESGPPTIHDARMALNALGRELPEAVQTLERAALSDSLFDEPLKCLYAASEELLAAFALLRLAGGGGPGSRVGG